MHTRTCLPIAVLLMALALPALPVRADSADEELRELHEKVMRAHRENNVDLLLEDGAADSVEANRGEIRRPSTSETRARFSAYLRDTRFETYRDMVQHARQLGANAIIAVRYDATELMAGLTEVLCYGTAVVVESDRA